MTSKLRLGVNIDHVATLRNARGGIHPDPLHAALLAKQAGADGITAHLREDRRHIKDDDVKRLKEECDLPLNLEMATTTEMQTIALNIKPNACCLVPEKREELTTEGGLDVMGAQEQIAEFIKPLRDKGIRISLFIDPEEKQIKASRDIGADIVELHTGSYCHTFDARDEKMAGSELYRLTEAARQAHQAGLEVHAGHGLNFGSVGPVAEINEIVELNIGHFLVGEAVFTGFEIAVRTMRYEMDKARGLV